MTRVPALGPRGEGWVLLQGILLALTIAAGFWGGGAWTREARSVTTAVGVLLGLGGIVLAVWGALDLGEGLTPFPRPRAHAGLIQTGPYALVRHPIYAGIVLAAVGWGLFTASFEALGCAAALFLLFDLKSRREEAWLAERYPGYDDYQRRTRRLVPGIY